ncbi:MAG: hypothetical protein CMH57_04975 [Myxococcales bacterium]|nr:hypothetical protein [Myxococcales bacterium]
MLIAVAVVFGVLLLIGFGTLVLLARFYRKVKQGEALIVSTTKNVEVTFTGRMVLPVIHRAEVMDISVKTIEIDRRGKEGLICKDNIRADIKVTFFVRVNEEEKDVLKVAKNVGCARASSQQTLEELFGAKFSEALKTVGKQLDFEELFTERDTFRDEIIENIGRYLNGYSLEDVAIDYLEQTSLDFLDPNNILDAQGRKKITERTATEIEEENLRKNQRDMKIGAQNLDKKRAMLNYKREEEDAEAKTNREIEVVRSTQRAEAEEAKAKQEARASKAHLQKEQDVNIASIGKTTEEQRAEKNRERDISLQTENIKKEVRLVELDREQTVELREIEKEKKIQVERKAIAYEIRERIAVEKTVAEEEEHIKDLRALRDAERRKKVTLTDAAASAEEQFIGKIKAAEAAEQVAKHESTQRRILADAEQEEADKKAKAQIRLAEGKQAQSAADGLAQAKVKEASAIALEKEGLAEAKVLEQKMIAEAKGAEEQGMVKIRVKQAEVDAIEKEGMTEAKVAEEKGMVDVRVKQATADAIEREGLAQAKVTEEQGMAEARVKQVTADALEKEGLVQAKVLEEKGMVDVRVKQATADAIEREGMAEAKVLEQKMSAEASGIEKKGLAEAVGAREKLLAEATGLAEKATAMKQLDETSRAHEEFRLRLEQQRVIQIEQIHASREVAKSQAAVLAEAFQAANVQVIGGDGAFFERYLKAATVGRSMDGFMDNSETARTLLKDYLSGEASLPADVRDILMNPPVGVDDVQKLTISAFLGRLMVDADDNLKAKLMDLMGKVKDLGIDEIKPSPGA